MRAFLQRTPRVAFAIVGVACALIVLEMQRMPSAHIVSFSMFAPVPYLFETAVLLIIALWYVLKPTLRLSEHVAVRVVVLVAVVGSSSLLLMLTPENPMISLLIQMLYRVSSALLVVLWGERLVALGARRAAFTLAFACLLSGLITVSFSLFESGTARLLLGLLPAVSGFAFLWYRPQVMCGDRSAQGADLERQGSGSSNRAEPVALEKPLPRFACATPKDLLLAIGLIAFPLICRGPVISLQSTWMSLQTDAVMTSLIQAVIGLGIAFAGVGMLFVAKHVWNRSFILVFELFVLPVTFIAFYTGQASDDLWFLHVLILDTTYKVTLFFILMTPFLFPESKKRNPAVPLFVSFAFMIGVRALFVGLFSVMPETMFMGLATVVVLATFVGGGALAFLVIQQQASEREVLEHAASEAAQVSLEERCGLVARRGDLTPREEEILLLLAQNYRAPYIAEKLVVSQSTVKTHMRNLYGKLGVHSQAELLIHLDREAESISADAGTFR